MTKTATATTRKSNARRVLRDRTRSNRASARLTRRGVGSLATHVMAAGATRKEASTVASSLRKSVAKLAIVGTVGRTYSEHKSPTVTRYTTAQVAAAAKLYRPRKAEYKAIAARIINRAF